MLSELRVGIIIPTLNGDGRFVECLASVSAQSMIPHRRLVIDSSSTDDTVAQAKAAGFEIKEISRADFSHGGTRQWAAECLSDCDILVYLTQDAILASPQSLAQIVRSFDDPRVAVAYGRQLPHRGAKPMEAHARKFNYGETSQLKDSAASGKIGAKVFFCSNSFAAYRRSVLVELGGFKRHLILGEDMEFAARSLIAGYANFYCAEATAFHSHDYSWPEQFRRYFDVGVFDAANKWMADKFGSHAGTGARFVRSELQYLLIKAPAQIPRALLQTIAKICGYRLGLREKWLPVSMKRKLSMSQNYWRSSSSG
jgi:rhamnosyltransferase